jgi:translation elongation factor EF-Ts
VLVDQRWVCDPAMTIADLVGEVANRTRENIQIRRFTRFHMGTA